MEFRVFPHYRQLLSVTGEEYQQRLEELAARVFAGEAWYERAVKVAVAAGTAPPGVAPAAELAALAASNMAELAHAQLARLLAAAPPPTGLVECHLFPCLHPDRRGGFNYAPGKMLIVMPLVDLWATRLIRNITHEYSHTLRMVRWPTDERHGYGPAYPYTVRDFLVFEGLAENLVEQFAADPAFPPPDVPAADETLFWDGFGRHLHLTGTEAYMVFQRAAPGLPWRTGYDVGYRVVRSFLERCGLTALEAHRLPYEEIYRASAYPHIL